MCSWWLSLYGHVMVEHYRLHKAEVNHFVKL